MPREAAFSMTECSQSQFEFESHFSRQVVGRFDGSRLTTDGGGLLLRQADRKIGLLKRVAACFTDHRQPERVEHELQEMLAQRIYGLARRHSADFTVGHVEFDLILAVIRLPLLVTHLDDFVAHHDLFVPKAGPPLFSSFLELRLTKSPLHPSVQFMNSVPVHSHRRKDLEVFHSFRHVERYPALLVQSQRPVESLYVSRAVQAKVALKPLKQSHTQFLRVFPEAHFQIVELLT